MMDGRNRSPLVAYGQANLPSTLWCPKAPQPGTSYQVARWVILLAVPSDHRRPLEFPSRGCAQADRVRLACPSLFPPAKKA